MAPFFGSAGGWESFGLKRLITGSTGNVLHELDGQPALALYNLVGNALKFTEPGGITIQVALDEPDRAEGDARQTLRFSVQDTGIGIAPASLERIFLPFSQADSSTTRRYGGTGLGRSICEKLVHAMGGQIGVASTAGLGSEFFFTIRAAKVVPVVAPPPVRQLASIIDPAFVALSILAVEDNPTNRCLLEMILRKTRCQVVFVYNGAEAIEAVRLKCFEVIFMDVQMPILDGYEATRRIRETLESGHAPWIIGPTANALEEHRVKCLEAGMNDYLRKPYHARDIYAAHQQILETRQTGVAV